MWESLCVCVWRAAACCVDVHKCRGVCVWLVKFVFCGQIPFTCEQVTRSNMTVMLFLELEVYSS